jgi:hypothetical protein
MNSPTVAYVSLAGCELMLRDVPWLAVSENNLPRKLHIYQTAALLLLCYLQGGALMLR